MRRFAFLLAGAVLSNGVCLAGTATSATAPAGGAAPAARVSAARGPALVQLAKGAMLQYLLHRTPAASQDIPKDLTDLANRDEPVAVTLRQHGQLVAQSIQAGASLPRNIMAAAIAAMRSPQLPDRITPEVLDSLTVEVEVLARFQPVAADELGSLYVPGMTGLRLSLVGQSAYALPSAGYEFGLVVTQMQAQCRVQLPASAPADQATKWETFSSMHFVGYGGPRGKTVWLYRGKTLMPNESIAAARMAQAAMNVGLYLRDHQAADGCYTAGDQRGSLGDHLYAAYAMARLAGSGEKNIDTQDALKYARNFLKQTQGRMYLAAEDPTDQLRATAMYILASQAAGQDDPTRDKLLATLMELSADGQLLPARLDGASVKPADATTQFIAYRAMSAAGQEASQLAAYRRAVDRLAPQDALSLAWKAWAGLVPAGTTQPAGTKAVACQSDLLDEQGGYALAVGQTPQTVLTALTALQLTDAGQRLDAQRFCYQMMYKPYEAYFAADSADWIGAVRAAPSAAATTLPACAAAIEAFLAK